MLQEELIQKIKELKEIRLSQERLNLMRQNLISQIKKEPVEFTPHLSWIKIFSRKAQSTKGAGFIPQIGFFDWLRDWLRFLQPIALTICLILILGGGPWLVSMASEASLPGETLYPIKQATERIKASLASEESKAQLQVEFAERRLEELSKITEDSLSGEKKVEKVEEVINDFKDNLAGASQHVKNTPKEKVGAIAKKTQKIRESLIKTREETSLSEVVQEKVSEAEKIVEEINYQILAALIKDSEKNDKKTASTTDKEVLIFIEENNLEIITTTDEIIKNLDDLEGRE